jgi:hypothetical protein
MNQKETQMHTEIAIVEGEAAAIGRDPRKMTEGELGALGHHKRPLLDAIREKCTDCCGGYVSEVRRCRISDCALWPYRLSENPFRNSTRPGMTAEQKAEVAARFARGKEQRKLAGFSG